MKVLTLKQPYATLIAEGLKEYEFRSWKTNYRGELLIHAGTGIDKEAMERVKDLNLEFPKKKIIAKVILEDCLEVNLKMNDEINKSNPVVYGSYKRDGFAWKLSKAEKLNIDKEINGQLGLWNYDEK